MELLMITDKEDCAYHYPKNKDGTKTGHTLCILVREDRIFVGESRCGGTDQFSRSTGRSIAKGRAEKSYARYLAKKQRNNP
jgi:hypothetical protein